MSSALGFAAIMTAGAVLAVLVMALGMTVARQGARLRRLRKELTTHAAEISRLNAEFSALLECSRTMGRRLGESERTHRQMQKRIEQVQTDDTDQVSIQHAMKLLDNGWQMTEVKEICDLTHGEIEILESLRQHKAA